ncbi:MAG TPA: hypothetical protein VIS09_31380 [Streptomyces sp.]
MPKQSAPREPTAIAPKLVGVSDEVLFADARNAGRPPYPRTPSFSERSIPS